MPATRIVRRLSDLSDFGSATAETGQVLRYSGDKWEAQDATYVHVQAQASSSWVIVHGLSTFPSVTVVDSAGTVVVGNVRYDSEDQVTVLFSAAFGGKAYLN
jgi:hypothetical protein